MVVTSGPLGIPFLSSIGTTELILILVIVLIFFGVGRLPEIGRALGEGLKSFRAGTQGQDKKVEEASKKELAEKAEKGSETDRNL